MNGIAQIFGILYILTAFAITAFLIFLAWRLVRALEQVARSLQQIAVSLQSANQSSRD